MKRLALAALLLALPAAALAETRVPTSQAEISLGFAPLVKEAAPAVVNIYARIVTQGSASPFRGDPFFEDFFRGFGQPRPRVQNSLGSGVILSDDGIVVSNYHVVGQATDIRVVLNDRREFNARVLLGDKEADIAILKLEGVEDLPSLQLRDSDHVEVGELVLAIGNPFGVGQTVSSGIVSGLARSGTATGNARGYFIQTDAPINPGNSGGALIDVNGDLIGINTSILTRSGGSNGIGFAIPANLVREFVHQARAGNDRFERPWAGVTGQNVDGDLAASLGLDVPEGILIADLHAASPLAAAGLQVGDVITDVDGQPVNSGQEMLFRMSVTGIGETAQVTAWHEGEERQFDVALIAAPEDPPREAEVLDDGTVLPGLEVARANPAVIAENGLSLNTEGVVVTDPGPNGLRAGLRPGDVVLAINGEEIGRPGDVAALLSDPGRRLLIEIGRDGRRVSLRFRLQRMADLFDTGETPDPGPEPHRPLADRLRPKTLGEVIGQEQVLGPDAPLGVMLAAGSLSSLVFWGPPGVGKTTIARLLAEQTDMHFVQISAIFSGVPELRKVFEQAKIRRGNGQGTLLFVDEIHRFNKAQQDGFLPHMEDGTILLVGATTENPSFELNAALLSRAQVLILTRLSDEDLERLIVRAEAELGRRMPLTDRARESLREMADGDGRALLNLVEQIAAWDVAQPLSPEQLSGRLMRRAAQYDKSGDAHYNLISALHKSVRGSDPDAAMYWLARMLTGGEDPRYLARRIVRMAWEDIGLADPQAFTVTLQAWETYERLGSPEGELALGQAVAYLALAPKSNAGYAAFKAAMATAKKTGSAPPPMHILNAPTDLMQQQGFGAGYAYDHDAEDGFSGQDYFPDGMERPGFYQPVERGFERELKKRLEYFEKLRARRQDGDG